MLSTPKRPFFQRANVAVIALIAALASACSPALQAQLRRASAPTAASISAERQLTSSVNRFRAAHGLRALTVHPNLVNKARSWAAWMAGGHCGRNAQGVALICHSNLASGITVRWSRLEENVGYVSPRTAVSGIEAGFERSAEHAANMLNNRITYIGVGVAYAGSFMYVAEEFMAP